MNTLVCTLILYCIIIMSVIIRSLQLQMRAYSQTEMLVIELNLLL